MANSLDVVADRVNDKSAVVIGMIVRSQTRRTVALGSGGQRPGMEFVYGAAIYYL